MAANSERPVVDSPFVGGCGASGRWLRPSGLHGLGFRA